MLSVSGSVRLCCSRCAALIRVSFNILFASGGKMRTDIEARQ
jgi:hypothetical protein